MVDKNEVKHIASLARIEFTEESIEKFQNELSNILAFVDILREVKIQAKEAETGERGQGKGEDLSSTAESDDQRSLSLGSAHKLVEALPKEKEGWAVVQPVF